LNGLAVNMIAIIMMGVLRIRFRLTDVAAATEASLIAGFNEKTIRKWRHEFYNGNGNLPKSESGNLNRPYVLNDENCRKKALSWLHSNAYKKEKYLTADIFAAWINTDLLPSADLPPDFPKSITLRTARRWLHSLGFLPTPYKKGVYYDGHERDDVKEYHRIYLRKLEILQSTHLPPPICPSGETEETIGAAGGLVLRSVWFYYIMMNPAFIPMKAVHANGLKKIRCHYVQKDKEEG